MVSKYKQVTTFLYENVVKSQYKDFFYYICFVLVFSYVSFKSKPGEIQYDLTDMARVKFATCENEAQLDFCEIGDEIQMYDWLEQFFVQYNYPAADYRGEPLDQLKRLYVLGQGRFMGAVRFRQVRSKLIECPIPNWLKDVGEYEVDCTSDFGWWNEEQEPFGPREALMNFSLPFTYRSSYDLNTTGVTTTGRYGFYYQSGYATDLIPNLSPNKFAEKVQACMPLLQQSIEECRLEQDVEYDVDPSPPPSPPILYPPPPLQLGADDEAGLTLSTTDFEDFTLLVERDVTLTGDDQALTFTFSVHNPGGVPLRWEFSEGAKQVMDAVSWFGEAQPASGQVQPIGDVECVPQNICSGQLVQFTIQKDQFYDLIERTPEERTVPHPAYPSAIIEITSPDFDISAEVKLNMFYTVPGTGVPAEAPAEGEGEAPTEAPTEAASKRRRSRALLQEEGEETEAPTAAPTQLSEEEEDLLEDLACEEQSEMQGVSLKVPSQMDPTKCVIKPSNDPDNFCQIEHIGFQMLLDLARDDACGQCKCKADVDPYCLEHCSTAQVFLDQLAFLRNNSWTDRQTRAVFMDVALLHPNYNLFQVIRLIIEFPAMGGDSAGMAVWPKAIVNTFRLYRYVTSEDWIVAVFECILGAMTISYTLKELVEIKSEKWNYLKDGWNYLDWANLIILYTVFVLRILGMLIISKFEYNSLSVEYIDFAPLGFIATQEINISAFNFFLLYFKFFKYLADIPRMDSILMTVYNATTDLVLFSIMFVIIQFGYSAAFYVTFGADLLEFRSLGDSMFTLGLILLGDFDYNGIKLVNSTMAPILFFSYIFLVFFILLNMFLAIIADSYAEVKGNQSEADLQYYSDLKDKLLSNFDKLFKKKQEVNDLAQELMKADQNVDMLIDEKELEAAFAANPRAYEILQTTGAKDLLQKYDVSGDGVLDKHEMTAILTELAEKEAQIQKEIDDAEKEMGENESEIDKRSSRRNRSRGGGDGVAKVDMTEMELRLDKVEAQIKEMSRNVAKKLSLMIDLMMSLSDQVASVNAMPQQANGQVVPVLR